MSMETKNIMIVGVGGQGSLLATPLDFAVLVCTIVNGGLRPEVRLVEGLLEEGELLRELGDEPRPVRVMSDFGW